jgi:hypothetical protein
MRPRPFFRPLWIVSIVLALCALLCAGTPGSFRGTIVESTDATAPKNWIYVQGRNGMARRVDVSHARISYDEDVPAADRHSQPSDGLVPGVEVRVTAEQGSDGEWRASRVEILKAPAKTQASQPDK